MQITFTEDEIKAILKTKLEREGNIVQEINTILNRPGMPVAPIGMPNFNDPMRAKTSFICEIELNPEIKNES